MNLLTVILVFLAGALTATYLMLPAPPLQPQTSRAPLGPARADLRRWISNATAKIREKQRWNEAWAFVLDFDDKERHHLTAVKAHIRAIRRWSFVERTIIVLVNEKSSLAKAAARFLENEENVVVRPFPPIQFDKKRLLVFKNVNRLHLWRLDMFKRIVFVTTQVALLHNLEYLFDYPDFAVVPNPETPWQFRTSLMVLRPSKQRFDEMTTLLRTYTPTWDTSDQAFLATYFNDSYTLLPWSSCPSVRTIYMRPDLWDFRDVTCLHWSQFAPWTWQKRTDLRFMTYYWYAYLFEHIPDYTIPATDYVVKSNILPNGTWPVDRKRLLSSV